MAPTTRPDPTTVSTVWHALQTACKEMRHIVDRTAQKSDPDHEQRSSAHDLRSAHAGAFANRQAAENDGAGSNRRGPCALLRPVRE